MTTVVATCVLAALVLGCGTDPIARPVDDMVSVPAGSFIAGCDPHRTLLCPPDATPYRAEVMAFEIDRTEVTIEQYERCLAAGVCKPVPDGEGFRGGIPDPVSRARLGRLSSSLPLWDVSGVEARAYCRWLGKRLPSELEWEKAARGTDGRPYPWGDAAPTCERVVLPECNGELGNTYLRPPGSVPAGASPYGALDMAGNVGEWAEPARDGSTLGDVVGVGRALVVQPHDIALGEAYPTAASEREFFLSSSTGFRCARSLPR